MERLKTSLIALWIGIFGLVSHQSQGHPMPNSVVNLMVSAQQIQGEAKMPYEDFKLAFGQTIHQNRIQSPEIQRYFLQHIRMYAGGKAFRIAINSIKIKQSKDPIVGNFNELWVTFTGIVPVHASRKFTLAYDVILHQIITHKILVYVVQDWEGGILNVPQQIGEITLDIPKGTYTPLSIDLGEGSWWQGFQAMIKLGMHHIAEGYDHILFLWVLLLPGLMRTEEKRWVKTHSHGHAFKHMLALVTAFTIGHSMTLVLGALHWLSIPTAWVEIGIALSIFISAVHAYRPIIARGEFGVVLGFGFIHGMAFASLFNEMQMASGQLFWSLLGFNLGIECMQILLMSAMLPLNYGISQLVHDNTLRKIGAILAGMMALYWVVDRCLSLLTV